MLKYPSHPVALRQSLEHRTLEVGWRQAVREHGGEDAVRNAFCPTGKGGGVDPTCSSSFPHKFAKNGVKWIATGRSGGKHVSTGEDMEEYAMDGDDENTKWFRLSDTGIAATVVTVPKPAVVKKVAQKPDTKDSDPDYKMLAAKYKLTPRESTVLGAFSGAGDCQYLQHAERTGNALDIAKDTELHPGDVAHLRSGLGKLPKVKEVAYRGLRLNDDELASLKPNSTYAFEGTQSFSTNRMTATKFAGTKANTHAWEDRRNNVLIHMEGSKDLRDYRDFNKIENEVVMPHKSLAKVTKVEKDSSGLYHVYMKGT